MKAVTPRSIPRAIWAGLVLIGGAGLAHLWLEYDRAMRIAPQLKAGPEIVAHTFEVITTAQALRRTVRDAERAQRSFLVTAQPAYLDAYRDASDSAPPLLQQLKRLTMDNPEQQRRWPILEHQISIRFAELNRTLEVYERRGYDAARELVKTRIESPAMQAIDDLIDATTAAERALLSERLARAAEFYSEGRKFALVGAALQLAALVVGVALVLFALRAMRLADAARRESDERFRFFVNSVTDYAIYMLDPQGYVMDWNAGANRIKGYTAEEIVGQHFSRFYTPAARQAGVPERALETAARDGRYEEEGLRVRKDGSEFVASVVIDPVRDASGKLIGFAKVTRDVQDRVQQQQALAQYQKMDALGQLTGGVAHDFNNLLHVIKNAVEILERRLRGTVPDVSQYLEMLKRNADRATSLTQRLLAFSRRQVLDPKPINPNALVVDVTTLLKQVLGEGIEIETVVGAGAWWISADPSQLETAILNLALNARDAMSGHGKLTIEIANTFLDENYAASHSEVTPGQYVMIAVSDTGSGMPPEVAARAFDPFFTTKEVGQGTGLGLSQVYGFTKQSNGHAKIYSEPGEGTTVKLYLPRLSGARGAQFDAPAVHTPLKKGRGSILVVEDDEDVCRFTVEVLTDLGYGVLSARDAAEALRALAQAPAVDLLFTDIGLPGGVNGRELADEARRRSPALRILFTTAYTRNAVIHHGRLDPGVDLIVKPFTQISLAEKLSQILGRRSA